MFDPAVTLVFVVGWPMMIFCACTALVSTAAQSNLTRLNMIHGGERVEEGGKRRWATPMPTKF